MLLLLLVLLVHLAAALVAPALMKLMGRRGFLVLAAAPAAAAIWAVTQTSAVLRGEGPTVSMSWMPAIGMNLDMRLDVLSWFMVVIVGGVGACVLFYCAWYFATGAKYLGRFAGIFVAFAGAMLGLVTTDNTLVLYVFWELTTVFSYLLVGHYFDRKGARRAAMQAIIVTTFGGLVMLAGIVILGQVDGGSYSLRELVENPVSGPLLPVALVCVLVGALSIPRPVRHLQPLQRAIPRHRTTVGRPLVRQLLVPHTRGHRHHRRPQMLHQLTRQLRARQTHGLGMRQDRLIHHSHRPNPLAPAL